jgi:hypothetical protein
MRLDRFYDFIVNLTEWSSFKSLGCVNSCHDFFLSSNQMLLLTFLLVLSTANIYALPIGTNTAKLALMAGSIASTDGFISSRPIISMQESIPKYPYTHEFEEEVGKHSKYVAKRMTELIETDFRAAA